MKIRIKNVDFSPKQVFFLALYYGIFIWMPDNVIGGGKIWKHMRWLCCKQIFKKCGKNVNIMRKAVFGSGRNLEIGDNSGLGVNCNIPGNTIIGDNVMMGPNCYILGRNHAFNRTDIPMIEQGFTESKPTVIGDDVWIGREVLMTPGRTIKKGTIIAGGTVLCKDFDEYSIVGGNPSRLIRSRLDVKDGK